MSDRIEDGGPAFPARPTETLTSGATVTSHHGMTLRDWFAGHVLAGILANPGVKNTRSDVSDEEAIAIAAYTVADAMLAARKGGA